ncbi:ATP-binding protein [Plectonema radiosum NIES-515]|uniref:histidine kinase n=1 Tax=Plectonema radiosum NIES-515 TaxID=2986073 RepID=A0ABT3AZL8_9CYAN|nr:ATP-binding protein [Plectonema radiosum]MCV3214565.1 ATP-binding protein [Plectonema radiosum NIES-515]
MLQYPLYDFVATVPSCRETTTLAVLLEIFAQQQCDRVIVVNQQEYPIGLLYSSRLIPQFLAAKQRQGNFKFLDLQQPISILDKALIEPIQILSASDSVDKFGLFLRSQSGESNNLNWTLIDAEKKYLGLVDTVSLLRLLAQVEIDATESDRSVSKKYLQKSPTGEQKNTSSRLIPKGRPSGACRQTSPKQKEYQPQAHKPLVQLLERLPWPLMLQTSSGEVITQNPAWWQQLGGLKDPEGVRQQVGEILNSETKESEYPTATIGNIINTCNDLEEEVSRDIQLNCRENTCSTRNEVIAKKSLSSRRKSIQIIKNLPEQIFPEAHAANRCLFDSNLGICTCVLEVQNGQERVWQFAKIPLESIELKILNPELEIPSTQESTGNELWLILATDVTEQQQLCKELVAKNADLVQLNRLKDEFLACISHELKTPLTAVLGLSRLLVDRQLGELNERQARYAGLIHQSGRHLMSVVNDILDLTRMETGQMELTLIPAKIRAVCDRAASEAKAIHTQNSKTPVNVQPQAPRSPDYQFTLTIEPGLDQIIADELRLRQMLIHLLSNAFKFTETGGEVGLRVSRWEGWIAFTVWDTGIGIPEHQQHLIFQKFQQLENPLTRQFEGTGLGLVLTRALARLHGGDVSFLSREGKGSQFTLLLPPSPPKTNFGDQDMGEIEDTVAHKMEDADSFPVLPRSRVSVSSTPANLAASEQRLVLVVEAVARYIEELTEQLTGLGYRVVIARSGCEAVEKARRLQPKALFLNPLLPLLSGWDVLTLIKSDAATRHIPVIVTATGAEKEQAFGNSADGFISLPVQHQVLAPLMEKLCAAPEAQQLSQDGAKINVHTPLRILRLVNSELESVNPHPSLREHRVIEVDDLDQAELLARVWQFDVILLDKEVSQPQAYLQQLSQHPRLAALPLVTCDVATTLEASQVDGLSVFPCLSSFSNDNNTQRGKTDALLSVLQIASGMCCPPSLLVVDLTMLPDLPSLTRKQISHYGSSNNSALNNLTAERGSEWFQALIQYLQTAGFKAAMGRSWAEMLQQIRHHSVDLLLIFLGESSNEKEARSALKTLGKLPFDLPPILVLDQRLNPQEVSSALKKNQKKTQEKLESIETVVDAIATQILPRSISMEDLLNQINQALKDG